MRILEQRIPKNVLEQLPARLPDRETIDKLSRAEGFLITGCPDAGDGEVHDDPTWRPYMTGERWDPHERAWDAFQGRGKTALERFRDMSEAVDELGLVRLELTLPPELHAEAWGAIVEDGGGDFARLGHRFVEELWDLFDFPGDPVGSWVSIHRTSSSLPHQVRPHLHVWAPALYRDNGGELHALERERGSLRPLWRPEEDLDRLRELWADLLEDHFGHRRDKPQNLKYRPLWARDKRDRARIVHGSIYNSRAHLEDVNDRVLSAGPDWCQLDVADREDLDQDVLTAETEAVVEGILTVQALTPKGWQQSRYYGELSHRNWADFAEELGIQLEDEEVTNLWGELLERGAEWARGHEDRDRFELLEFMREGLSETVLRLAMHVPDAPDPPTPRAVRAWSHRSEAIVHYVTLPLKHLCFRCGQRLEQIHGTTRDLVDVHQACQGESPIDEDPTALSRMHRLSSILDRARQHGDFHRLRWERTKHRMRDDELEQEAATP